MKKELLVGQSTFNLISNIMRYWFAGLIILITVRLFISVMKQSSKERVNEKKQTQQYQMGLLEIIQPRENKKIYGQRFALRRENTIGRSSQCDIQIQERSVRPVQARIFQKGNQIFIRSMENKVGVYLNGERVEGDIPLLDGDEIELSDILIRLSLRGQGGKRRTPKKEEASPWDVLPQEDEEDFYDEDNDYYDDGDLWDDDENVYYDESDDEKYYNDEEEASYYDDDLWDDDETSDNDESDFRRWQRRRK